MHGYNTADSVSHLPSPFLPTLTICTGIYHLRVWGVSAAGLFRINVCYTNGNNLRAGQHTEEIISPVMPSMSYSNFVADLFRCTQTVGIISN